MGSVSVSQAINYRGVSATISWDSGPEVTVEITGNAGYGERAYWRIRGKNPDTTQYYPPADYGRETDEEYATFNAVDGVTYMFQAVWGGTSAGAAFTVNFDSGGGGGGGGDFPDIPDVYAIRYDANGGTGAPSTHFKIEGEVTDLSWVEPIKDDEPGDPYIVTLDANGGESSVKSLNADRIKYFIFGYWNTKPDGSGTTYHPGGSYSHDAPLTLYAIYLEDTVTKGVELPAAVRNGYEFLGWSTDQNAISGITGTYYPNENTKFYAIWKANGLLYIYDGDKFSAYQVFIYDGISWDLYCPYVYDSGWSLCS